MRNERSKKTLAWLIAALCAAGATGSASLAAEPTIWLNVEVDQVWGDHPNVKVRLPLSLIEVAINSVDSQGFLSEMSAIHVEHDLDLRKIWIELRDADMDEFMRIDTDEGSVKVYKDQANLLLDVHETGYDEPNVKVRLPFGLVDYLVNQQHDEFRLSELVATLRGSLPLLLIDANRQDGKIKVWLEEE